MNVIIIKGLHTVIISLKIIKVIQFFAIFLFLSSIKEGFLARPKQKSGQFHLLVGHFVIVSTA